MEYVDCQFLISIIMHLIFIIMHLFLYPKRSCLIGYLSRDVLLLNLSFCSSWTSCYNMIIYFIAKITFLLITLFNKMCTILTDFPDFCLLFLFSSDFSWINIFSYCTSKSFLTNSFNISHCPLFLINIYLFTQFWQPSCYQILIRLYCIILILMLKLSSHQWD